MTSHGRAGHSLDSWGHLEYGRTAWWWSEAHPSAVIGLHLYANMHIPGSRARSSTRRCNHWPRMVVRGTDSTPGTIWSKEAQHDGGLKSTLVAKSATTALGRPETSLLQPQFGTSSPSFTTQCSAGPCVEAWLSLRRSEASASERIKEKRTLSPRGASRPQSADSELQSPALDREM